MTHPYKSQLLLNLKAHYNDRNWRIISYFTNKREEILFVIPETENIKAIFEGLYPVLAALPEIDFPSERVVISFCYPTGTHYCSQLINPSKQDEINLALIGYRPERKIHPRELEEINSQMILDPLIDFNNTAVHEKID